MASYKDAVDWDAIRLEYVTGNIGYRQLAQTHGIPMHRLSRRAIDEGWTTDKKKYREKLKTKTMNKLATKNAGRLAKLIDATAKVIDVANEALHDDQQFNRYIFMDGEKPTECICNKIDSKSLRNFAAIIKDMATLMREFYDIPTPEQAEAKRIAAERLELDRMRAQKDNGIDRTIIVQLGNAEELSE